MYGSMTLAELEASVRNHAESLGTSPTVFLEVVRFNGLGEILFVHGLKPLVLQ